VGLPLSAPCFRVRHGTAPSHHSPPCLSTRSALLRRRCWAATMLQWNRPPVLLDAPRRFARLQAARLAVGLPLSAPSLRYAMGLCQVTALARSFRRARLSRADGAGLPPRFSEAAFLFSWVRHGALPAFRRRAAGGAATLDDATALSPPSGGPPDATPWVFLGPVDCRYQANAQLQPPAKQRRAEHWTPPRVSSAANRRTPRA
jgi:hypothetical protein